MINNRENFFLIGRILSLDDCPASKEMVYRYLQSGFVNWDLFFRICDSNLIIPAVYLKFVHHEMLHYVPEEVSGQYLKVYELNRDRNHKILDQISSINNLLYKYDISPVYLKGAGQLLDGVYCDIGERFMFDIDFIVPEEEFLRSIQILESDGYRKLITTSQLDKSREKHYPRMIKNDFVAGIEIHHRLVKLKYNGDFNFNHVKPDKQIALFSTSNCFVLSNEHKVIHNMINSQLNDNDYLYARANLRQMYDLILLSRKVDAYESFKQFGFFLNVANGYLKLINRIFGVEFKSEWPYRIRARLHFLRYDLNIRSDWWQRIADQCVALFNTPEMRRAYLRNILRALIDQPFRREHLKRLFMWIFKSRLFYQFWITKWVGKHRI